MPDKISSNNDYHTKSVESIIKELSTTKQGLTSKEAAKRLKELGPNTLPGKKHSHPIFIFLKQFKSLLVFILIIAAGISYFFAHMIDTIVIIFVILFNAVMGFIQEYKAEKSIQALKKLMHPYAKVIRNGELVKINAEKIVEGDLIILEEGDKVPADARLIECNNLRTIESSLTGESFPVDKEVNELSEDVPIPDQKNMVWMSTFVTSGYAKAIVTDTGVNTAIGSIASEISEIKEVDEHFQIKVDLLAKQMAIIAIIGASIILIVGYLKEMEFVELTLFSISSLVSGIPEGLPAVLVVVLSIGASRMADRNAITRKLNSIETLGVVNTIITDKTGTLTMNTMNVEHVLLPGFGDIRVTGEGWKPEGEFYQNGNPISPLENKTLDKLLHISRVCNNSKLIKEEENHKIIGDPTEGALKVLAEKAGLKKSFIEQSENRIDDMPFNSKNRFRASLVKTENEKQVYVIGATEKIVSKASKIILNGKKVNLTKDRKEEIYSMVDDATSKAMRVLCLAYKKTDSNSLNKELINDLIIVGMVGMADPIRPEVPEAVMNAKKAGIRIIMATGDHKNTALAIAKEAGIINHKDNNCLTESELNKLSEKEFEKTISKTNVFARLTPKTKLRIAEILQEKGEIIAMTGDGVNDAPALKKADIGISMGVIGTDVAKEASDMVLADDNFATIVNAIEEGRIVFDNTRKTSYYLIATNFAEDLTIILTLLMGLPLPLLPTQILWLNLVTDGVSDIALATEPGHGDTLSEKPRNSKKNIISKNIVPFILIISTVMCFLSLLFFSFHYQDNNINKARTITFSVMAFSQLWKLITLRSLKKSIFKIGFFSNKYINISLIASIGLYFIVIYIPLMRNIFRFVSLSIQEILIIFFSTSLVLIAGEVSKKIIQKKQNLNH